MYLKNVKVDGVVAFPLDLLLPLNPKGTIVPCCFRTAWPMYCLLGWESICLLKASFSFETLDYLHYNFLLRSPSNHK